MQRLIIVALLCFTQGCVSQAEIEKSMDAMYNVPSSGTSQFDKTKYIRVSKISCSNTILFELYQDTKKHEKGIVLLQAGTNTITNIGNKKSLLIKIDDKTLSFKSNSVLTNHDTYNYGYGVTQPFSHKTFILPESVIRNIASSKEFLSRLYLLDNTYVEGKCSSVTLQEYKNNNKNSSYSVDVTQEGIDSSNKYTAQNGFRKFVKLIDSTKW